jgi:hypothetical protein
MKKLLLLFTFILTVAFSIAQEQGSVKGKIVRAGSISPLENVNIVNLSQVIGTATNTKGEFKIRAKVNDTLHFSYLGFKSIKVRVTSDWIKFGISTTIEMTELALALEKIVITQLKLTGYLEIDIKQVPLTKNIRYSISGLPNAGLEGGHRSPGAVTKVLGAIFNPFDFLHNMFGKVPNEMRKLRKMKQDDQIRNLLASRFDRETLLVLLQIDRLDLDLIVSECNYSKDFINTANDLQILDAISECYEEYKVLSRGRKKRL